MEGSWPQLYLPPVTFSYRASVSNEASERAIKLSNMPWFMQKKSVFPPSGHVCFCGSVWWLWCFFSLRVCEAATSNRFVKGPIMVMICSPQWLYVDDLISSLSGGKILALYSSPSTHSFRIRLSSSPSSAAMTLHSSARWQTLLSCIPAVTAWRGPLNPITPSTSLTHTHTRTDKHGACPEEWSRQR